MKDIISIESVKGQKAIQDASDGIYRLEEKLKNHTEDGQHRALHVFARFMSRYQPDLDKLTAAEAEHSIFDPDRWDALFPDWESDPKLRTAVITVLDYLGHLADQQHLDFLRNHLKVALFNQSLLQVWRQHPECKTTGDLVNTHKEELSSLHQKMQLEYSTLHGGTA